MRTSSPTDFRFSLRRSLFSHFPLELLHLLPESVVDRNHDDDHWHSLFDLMNLHVMEMVDIQRPGPEIEKPRNVSDETCEPFELCCWFGADG